MSRSLALTGSLTIVALLGAARGALADGSVWDLLRSGGPSRRGVARHVQVPAAPDPRHRGGGGFFGDVHNAFAKLGKDLHSDIKIQGQHTTSFHLESVSGSDTAYQDSTYYGREGVGGTYNNTDLTIQGKIEGVINFETHYTNSLYGSPDDNRLSLNYATKGLKLDAGDINGSISGNSLIQFSRSLKGIELAADLVRGLKLTTLYSETKAEVRTVTLTGANRSGPYYVYSGMIVDGSEHVRVNNVDKVKGQDYTLDPYTGELNFLNGFIVHEYDTIAVTFEVYGYGQSAGLLTGYRADLTSLGNARLGITYLSEQSGGGSNAGVYRTEQFYGYNNADTPYTLQYAVGITQIKDANGNVTGATPVYPMTVMVGSVPQTYGVDYAVDPQIPNRVYFKLAIPATQIIRITYVPVVQGAVAGNRQVYGVDTGVSLGKTGTIVAEWAQSSLGYSSGNVSGGAWQVRGDIAANKDRLRWTWNLRNIASNFTNIENAGFNQNDRGYTMGLDYRASPSLQLTGSYERSKRADYGTTTDASGVSSSIGLDDYTATNLAANWRLGSKGQLSYTHNDNSTALVTGSSSGVTSDTMAFTYALKRVSMDFSFGHTLASARSVVPSSSGGSSGSTTSIYSADALTSRLGLRWQIASGYSLSTSFSGSRSRDQSGSSSNSQDISFNAEMNPAKNLRVSLGYDMQDSGSLSTDTTSYFDSGLGAGGSYSGGLTNTSGAGLTGYSFGGRSSSLTATANYQPSRAVTLGLNLSSSTSVGDYLYNSDRNSAALTASYNAGERLSLNATYNIQNVSYVGSTGSSSTNMFYLNARTRPFGKLTASLSYQLMNASGSATTFSSTGTTTTGTTMTGTTTTGTDTGTSGTTSTTLFSSGGSNTNSYSMRLEYPIWRVYTLYAEYMTASSSGYLASQQNSFSVGTDIGLSKNVHFVTGWRMQQFISKDPTTSSSSNYRVNSLDADFNVHF